MDNKKIKVAEIRGNGLSDRETKTWEYFPKDIDISIFGARKIFIINHLRYYQSKHCTQAVIVFL